MNDERAQEIRAALDELDGIRSNPSYSDQKSGFMLRARAINLGNEIGESAPDWLRDLLDERDKMVAVAEAARAWWTMPDDVSMDEVIMICDALEAAISALG